MPKVFDEIDYEGPPLGSISTSYHIEQKGDRNILHYMVGMRFDKNAPRIPAPSMNNYEDAHSW